MRAFTGKIVRRRGARASIAAVLALFTFFVSANSASAYTIGAEQQWSDSTHVYVSVDILNGSIWSSCRGEVTLTGSNDDYAYGSFINYEYTNTGCTFYLQRSVYSGGDNGTWSAWQGIGSYATSGYYLGTNQSHTTSTYWDGPDNRVRACFTISLENNYYLHCSSGI